MKSIYVIIDASSYINLSAYQYGEVTLLNVLDKTVTLRYSSTVNQEVAHHWANTMPDSLTRSAKIHRPKKYTAHDYEQILFDNISQTDRDKGEKDNFAVAIDLFLTKKRTNLIFLTDDDKAIELNGCLYEVKSAFPIIKIWNSFDVVLFLYFVHKLRLDIAEDALKDLNRQIIPNDPNVRPEKMVKRQKNLARYGINLYRIKKLYKGI